MTEPKTQPNMFKDTAREALCDEDEARWAERLKKVVKQTDKPE